MKYRVSRHPVFGWRWWCPHEILPEIEMDIRPATPEEAALMDQIYQAKGMPPASLGEKIRKLMDANANRV